MEREKRIRSGKLLEVEFYPIFENGRKVPNRMPKSKSSTPEQQKYNTTQAIKKFVRLVNTNFDNTDLFMSPTYLPQNAPQNEDEARRDIVNYLRRVKTKRTSELRKAQKQLAANPDNKDLAKRCGKLAEPFRYIYVIEKQTYKTGINKGRNNWHFHLFLTGGLDRDTLEDMWPKGIRVNTHRFQPERFGPEAAARYCSKDPQGSKRFVYSRNLKKPIIAPPRDGKITPRGVERLALDRVDDREYWERRHKGYKFIRCFARFNVFNGHWYISVVMYKADSKTEIPTWQTEWLEE